MCPNTASTWWGKLFLSSRAYKYSSSLTRSAYAACCEAASALHIIAFMQVHQAKALKDLHEGGHDPEVLKELQNAIDPVLRAKNFTARSLRHAMSTLVVQECHLWLCLADMRDANKIWFINAPMSLAGTEAD